ncbi:MAG: primosomal protein N' [Neisseriaceae bacterium]|nr:primosomal protein N' [Neisseriaceae bacterium]
MKPIYHNIAVNRPLEQLFTYAHDTPLPIGRRVVVPFNNTTQVGIVWQSNVTPEIEVDKILPIQTVFDDEPPLPQQWLDLIEFSARYYHYPLGAAAFVALPTAMRQPEKLSLPKTEEYWTLSDLGRQTMPPRYPKQLVLWNALFSGCLNRQMAKQIHTDANKFLQKWQELGYLKIADKPQPVVLEQKIKLNTEQAMAVETVLQKQDTFAPFLLWGITGSGKTEVYFEMMAEVIKNGGQALFLVPEINLTAQLLDRLRRRFPAVETAVLHSGSAKTARSWDYLRAMNGTAKIIVGTRLSIFTPIPRLSLIVVDEEHDNSYKQDNDLRYNARDLAVWRAKYANCPVVLGSATPSLESFQAAQNNRYRLITMKNRANPNARLPEIEIFDVKRQKLNNGLSDKALNLLEENLRNQGLSLVYINRRGFAPALFCGDCGYSFSCPNCSAKMVWHKYQRHLRCHHCDHKIAIPKACPDCGNQDLTAVGYGTQRIEETLKKHFQAAHILRIDSDTIARKDDWSKARQAIENGTADIIIGTQMLAKGHDFGRLNLVIVVNADGSLYSADFRAVEHLFAELMQVAGRAGRAERASKVFIQTQLPHNPLFLFLKNQDYQAFADNELAQRKQFNAPPTVYAAAIRADAVKIQDALSLLNNALQNFRLPEQVTVYGPAPQLMTRLAGRERVQLFLESPNRQALHAAVTQFSQQLNDSISGDIRMSIDIDPYDC